MLRKWTILTAVMAAVALTATGISLADDEESPVHKLMEQVNAKTNFIKKAVRTKVAYAKAQPEVVKSAQVLIDLGKKARDMKEPSEKQKKSLAEWQKLTDDFIRKTEDFKAVVSKTTTTSDQAKKALGPVNASCASCHAVFRVEDDN